MAFSKETEGGLWQLWLIASFLMLSTLSTMAMMFIDRLILAQFSIEAHNAAVETSNLGWAFQSGLCSLTAITQIFVSQYYGAGKSDMLSRPAWQMIWLSLFLLIFFIPFAFWFPEFLYVNNKVKSDYLFWVLLFVPIQGVFAALCGYFVGQKELLLTIKAVIFGNIINGVCAYALIFGIGIIPSFGASGAIIGTDIAILVQTLVLFLAFWKKSKSINSSAKHYKFDLKLFLQCCNVGLPNALFSIVEALGWTCFYWMIASLGHIHLTVAGIVQNVLILSYFFGDGLRRAVSTMAGNAIGSQRIHILSKIVNSAFILLTIFSVGLGIFLWLGHDFLGNWFLSELTESERALVYPALIFGLINTVIYKFLEGIRLSIWGVLNAASDTKFLLISGASSVWLFMVLPIYLFVMKRNGTIEEALIICSFYTLATAIIFMYRFYNGKWLKNASLVEV